MNSSDKASIGKAGIGKADSIADARTGSTLADMDREIYRLVQLRIEHGAAQAQNKTQSPGFSGPSHEMFAHHVAAARDNLRDVAAKSGADWSVVESLAMLLGAATASRLAPKPLVAFLGPIYSYSHLAAIQHFGAQVEFAPVDTLAAVFDYVQRNTGAVGIVPIENSTDGRIIDTLGLFARLPLQICGEVFVEIHHCLLAACKRDEIRKIYSKPQAISQCRRWLTDHVVNAEILEVASTAKAAALAASEPGAAAIASRQAGMHHGLHLIAENIEDNVDNVTRFAVIGEEKHEPTGHDKTSIFVQLHHQAGALANAMHIFSNADINLTWIDSYPVPGNRREYLFYIEFEGHHLDKSVQEVLGHLAQISLRLDILGSYARSAPH